MVNMLNKQVIIS